MSTRRDFLKNVALTAGGVALTGSLLEANPSKKATPIIVIHGGTSGLGLTQEEFLQRKAGMEKSLLAGQKVLSDGGTAIEAVIAAIKVMEDDPLFNAGEGADKLAKENGLEMVDQKYFFTEVRWNQLQEAKKQKELLLDSDKARAHLGNYTEPYLGTVGAAALDAHGNLAAGTSTGGMTNKMTGRIGDSPIIGAGNYADNNSLALSCTGTGDIFIQAAAAHETSALYKYKKLSAQKAAEATIKQVASLGGAGGIVSVDKNGIPGYAWTSDKLGMFHGEAKVGGKPKVFFPVKK